MSVEAERKGFREDAEQQRETEGADEMIYK